MKLTSIFEKIPLTDLKMPEKLQKHTFIFLLFVAFFLLLNISAFSQVFIIDQKPIPEKAFLNDHELFVYEDMSGNLSFGQISASDFQHNFVSHDKEKVYTSKSTIWLKCIIANISDVRRDFVLFSNDWDVQFFSPDSKTDFFKEHQGVLPNNFNNKFYSGENADGKIKDYLLPNSSKTYYIKTPGVLYDIAFKSFDFVYISDTQIIEEKALFDLWSSSIYVGVLFLVLLANFYLIITAYKRSYIFYAFYSMAHVLFFTGYYQIPTLLSFKWAIPHSVFLPITAVLYLLFVHDYLNLEKHNKWVSTIFKTYMILTSIAVVILFYLGITDMITYYSLLPKVNITNLAFLLVSTILITIIPGRFKYFIFTGTLFIMIGSTITWITQYNDAMAQTFSFSIAGNAIEKIVFLFGIFYLHNQERQIAKTKLMAAQKQLELKTQELQSFSNSIREKNKLIEEFEKQIEESQAALPQKQENLQQLSKAIILTEEDWEDFKALFEEVHPNFFFTLKQDNPELTNAEMRLVALLKLKLSNKEIAGMLGISPDSVVKTKYRLKKKLSIYLEVEKLESFVENL